MGNRAETTARLPGVEANLRTIYNNLTQLGSIVSAR